MSDLIHWVCHSCASEGPPSDLPGHEALTRNEQYLAIVEGQHRGHNTSRAVVRE